jgi:hypothetical protein
MDVFLEETDDRGLMPSYSKVAVAAIVGNEDGTHFASAQIFQALNDIGWTIPAVAACYWVDEAVGSTDFKDLDETPKMVVRRPEWWPPTQRIWGPLAEEDPLFGLRAEVRACAVRCSIARSG